MTCANDENTQMKGIVLELTEILMYFQQMRNYRKFIEYKTVTEYNEYRL